MTIKRLLTDNGDAFRSHEFGIACKALNIKPRFTRPYRPQTNGKAERFIQSALREWAYGWTYQNSNHRAMALASWQHHSNCHRPHSGRGGLPPMSRIGLSESQRLDTSQPSGISADPLRYLTSASSGKRWARATARCSASENGILVATYSSLIAYSRICVICPSETSKRIT